METQRPSNVHYIDKHDRTWQENSYTKLKQLILEQLKEKLAISSKKRFSTYFRWQYNNPQFYTLNFIIDSELRPSCLRKNEKDIRITDTHIYRNFVENTETLLKEIIGIAIPLSINIMVKRSV